MPPSTMGNASRHSRSASPSPRYAASSGFGRSRGRYGVTLGIADHERVERLGRAPCCRSSHRAQQRLGVRDRRRPAERGRDRELGPQRPQHVAAKHLRQRAIDVPQWRSRDPLERLGIVRDSRAGRPTISGWLSTSETPSSGTRRASARSSASARCQPCDAVVSSSEYAPAARSASAPAAASSVAGPPCSTDSAALTTMTRSVSTSARFTRNGGRDDSSRRHELGVLDVVHDDVAVEAARELRRHERPELALRHAPREPRCDEERLISGRDAVPLELRHDGEIAACLGSFGAPGIGSAGGSITIVARVPLRACSGSPSPSSGSAAHPARLRRRRRSPPREAAGGG